MNPEQKLPNQLAKALTETNGIIDKPPITVAYVSKGQPKPYWSVVYEADGEGCNGFGETLAMALRDLAGNIEVLNTLSIS